MTNEEIQNHPSILLCKEIIESGNQARLKEMIDLSTKHAFQAKQEMHRFFNSNIIAHLNNTYTNLEVLNEINKYLDSFARIINGDANEKSTYEWRFHR